MYTEYEERKGFPFRDFLIKLVLIVVFVLLLLWLLPIPNMKGVNNTVFNANVQTMKDAAINYFTTERLPEKVGDKVTLTLKEMLDLKLLLPFTDKNGDTCDVSKSYVTLEKMDTEYIMTVHLKCKGQEDEIKVHLGCYSYCTSAICEKEEKEEVAVVTGPSCTLMIASGKAGENGWYLGDVVVKFKSKTTTSGAKITNYGIGLTSNYDGKDKYSVTKDGITKVYGYVKDSKGKTAVCSIEVKKDTVKPNCDLTVLSGSTNSSGSYITDAVVGFKTKTDATSGVKSYGVTNSSKVTYNGKDKYTVSTNGTTKVYGYVKDAAGHTTTCDISINRNAVSKTSVPSCSLEVTSGTVGANSWYTNNVVVGFKTKTSTNGATITAYGIGPSKTYDKNTSYTINKDGNFTINGYVKDSNGNTATCSITVKRDATKPSCSLAVLSGTKNSNGSYTTDVVVGFKTKTDAASGLNGFGLATTNKVDYNKLESLTVTNNGTHTLTGFVKDNAGNTNVCSLTITKVAKTYEYEYKKPFATVYGDWSNWTSKSTSNASELPSWGLSSDGLTENKYLGKTSDWNYTIGNAIFADQLVETPGASVKTCADYTYYQSKGNSKVTYAIKVASSWQDLGLVSLSSTPVDTLSVKYEFVGFDWDRCGDTCTTTPYTIWHKYSRKVSTVTYTDTTAVVDGVTVECSSYVEKPIITFNTFNKFVGYEQTRSLIDVYNYQVRTRKLISAAYTDVKWSSYNDPSLLTSGYTMTGNYRLVG